MVKVISQVTRAKIVRMYADPEFTVREIADEAGVSSALVHKIVKANAPELLGSRKRGVPRSFNYDELMADVARGYSVKMAAQRHGICRETASRVLSRAA